ncbi:uncharacterized protein K444DRAFT_611171 [Hyaloscypha bicolor E]|uniref:Uncharacterized protein n=1 Tax=Hyaloscypha bicolor E TaxID=1095630 RepID=A0A2J6TG00_9HELO|nr:uncharacterized protein K444DRAFT_611171 [Hyaloscypha bicolor E]PMD61955.1 hypothetical protein K444DRAFT_611171 [Hyaloscypha bicolor E]
MNNPPPAPQLLLPFGLSNAPDASDSDSTGTWDDEGTSASEDSDEEACSLPDEGCADEGYWEDETAADAWLARFPGGISALYPQLFLVKPRGGKVVTLTRYPDRTDSLLHLPPEIRNRIYIHYFDRDEEVRRPKESYAPFQNRDGIAMQRILLGSENVELKFWLSTALLQTSRQLRHEAMFILFSNRVITIEWLPALPRLVKFLGKEGCAMVRYLDIWDTLNVQGEDIAGYREIITSIMQFPGLLHLRIVVSWGIRHMGLWSDRTFSWLDATEWNANGTPKEDAIPKMRAEDIDLHWPECDVLKKLKAQKFTLAVITFSADRYLEFDRSYGPLPDIIKSIQSDPAPIQSIALAATLTSSTLPQVLDPFEAVEIQPRSSALTPNSEFDDEGPDSPAWQDTDLLTNKTIPFYNFFREFFYNNPPYGPRLSYVHTSFQKFVTFPTARKSTGAIMRDCVFCYISERHCEYHAMPDQPPFEPKIQEDREEGDDDDEDEGEGERFEVEKDVKILQAQFQDLSYVDMQMVCQELVQWMEDHGKTGDIYYHKIFEFSKISAFLDYQGWPDTPLSERLVRLDRAVDAGWIGKRVDKEEIPPWDMLYREFRSCYSHRLKFREEPRVFL